jgi:hypothetical protein
MARKSRSTSDFPLFDRMCQILQVIERRSRGAVWNVLPELTEALLRLSSAPIDIPEEVLHTNGRFVILLYGRTNACTDTDKARKKLLIMKNNAG